MEDRIRSYLQAQMPEADVKSVHSISRIHGGASRETYRFRMSFVEGGVEKERGLILRRDPEGSLIDTERALEYKAYSAFSGSVVPVPAPLFLEEDEKWLDRPFFIMEEIEGCQAGSPFGVSPYLAHAERTGEQFWRILGEIAARDVSDTGLEEVVDIPALDQCHIREVDYWENVINEDELEPHPLIRAAIRWLRRTPPPPAQKLSVVHGDYRTGNFLYDEAGDIKAILDWEMTHVGDPFEDLGWAMNELWAYENAQVPGGMIHRDKAIKIWEEASGLEYDHKAYKWWEIFNCVKGLGIWISSAQEYQEGKNQDPVLALSAWLCTGSHQTILLGLLKEEGVCP